MLLCEVIKSVLCFSLYVISKVERKLAGLHGTHQSSAQPSCLLLWLHLDFCQQGNFLILCTSCLCVRGGYRCMCRCVYTWGWRDGTTVKIQVWFPASTWLFTTICNFIPRRPNDLSWFLWTPYTHVLHSRTCRQNNPCS